MPELHQVSSTGALQPHFIRFYEHHGVLCFHTCQWLKHVKPGLHPQFSTPRPTWQRLIPATTQLRVGSVLSPKMFHSVLISQPWKRRLYKTIIWINLFMQILTPDIRFNGELVVGQALWCCPLDWEFGPSVGSVRVTCHQPAQAKVCHLHQVVLPYKAVSGSEVSENKNKNRQWEVYPLTSSKSEEICCSQRSLGLHVIILIRVLHRNYAALRTHVRGKVIFHSGFVRLSAQPFFFFFFLNAKWKLQEPPHFQ